MTLFALFLLAALVGLALSQLLSTTLYLRRFQSYRTPEVADDQLPNAVIALCLRGADPFLNDCLERLAAQDYPRFAIRVVIDSLQDPACEVVQRWQAAHPELRIQVSFLRQRFPTCPLICSAIYQAISDLDPTVEAVALVNADTMVYPRWLRAMVTPLLDERVGVVTGNRWYVPARGRFGSLVRYVWNAAAVVPMYFLGLTWTGSVAIKRAVLDQPQFFARLRKASIEDEAIRDAMQSAGLRLVSSPAVMMLNREECDLRDCFTFIRRQLLWTRLYHPSWTPLVAQAFATTALIALAGGGLALALAEQAWTSAGLLIAALDGYLLAMGVVLALLHRAVLRRAAAEQHETVPPMSPRVLWKLLLALPLTQGVYTWAVASAIFLRRLHWRGISYAVVSRSRVRLLEYRPYAPANATADNALSL